MNITRLAALALAVLSIGACCRKATFATEDRAALTLTEEMTRLGPHCDRWFVRECDAGPVHAIWFFRPRIDGPAETAAYDGGGALLYQRQFGTAGGWSFTPVRTYGAAPACRPALDSSGADHACDWIEVRKAGTAPPAPAATPAATATPGATATPTPT